MLWFLITSAIGVIKTQSNIEDGAFCENGLQLKRLSLCPQKATS